MATKKPKTAAKPVQAKTAKSKMAAKTVEKPVSEAPKTNMVENAKTPWYKGFFAKKYESDESASALFTSPKFYGALIGELLGTLLISLLLITFAYIGGIANAAGYSFAILAIFIAVYAFSGACLNPLITVGMMASRRLSVVRGVMYIVAEIIGAGLGWAIFNGFYTAGGTVNGAFYDMPALAPIAEGQFWIVTMVEFVGAIIIAFFFARALKYKRSVFTFGAVIAGGLAFAVVMGYIVSGYVLGLNNNFIFNPATALMLQIFPTAGESFGEVLGGICQALAVYAIFPMIGGVCGFYLSDFVGKLSSED